MTQTSANPRLSRAAVVGAGSMGSAIAAHIANAGVPVLLLDIVPPGEGDRNRLALAGVERQKAAGGFMHPDCVKLVEVGNVEDHLDRLADVDWIVEAVFEDLGVKQDLYRRLETVRKDGSIVSSNTSTIPLAHLIEGMGERFGGDFVITHFFNPPRAMQLLELVGGPQTRPETLERARAIGDVTLGKTVVVARDTPGFIANRVGNYWMSVANLEAIWQGLTVEETDTVMSAPFGIPRTGIFGLMDFVGINLVPLVWGSFMKTLPAGDTHRNHDLTVEPLFKSMLERGLTGRTGPGGFYRRKRPDGAKVDEVLDLQTGEYRERRQPELPGFTTDLKALCDSDTKAGRYAWSVLSNLIVYSATWVEDIADSIDDIDSCIRLGYSWERGPFKIADQVGAGWIVAKLKGEGREVPALLQRAAEAGGFYPSADQELSPAGALVARPVPAAAAVASASKGQRVTGNEAASIRDVGDGVAVLEIHTKMNACNARVVEVVESAFGVVKANFSALVIANDNPRAFSAGADLNTFIEHVRREDWAGLDAFVARGQAAWLGLKRAAFPVVAGARGVALGGGAELMLHADKIVAHSELAAGLPERLVGIIPGWGGTVQLLLRAQARGASPAEATRRAFATIAAASPSSSALVASDMGFLRDADRIVMNRDRIFAEAKVEALRLAAGYTPPAPASVVVSGADGHRAVKQHLVDSFPVGKLTATDLGILEVLANVLTGGSAKAGSALGEEAFLTLEREGVLELARRPTSLARLEAMRDTNRPLAN